MEGDRAIAVGGQGDLRLVLGVANDEGVGRDELVVRGDATAGDEGDGGEEEGGAEEAVLGLEGGEMSGGGRHGRDRTAAGCLVVHGARWGTMAIRGDVQSGATESVRMGA